jgi:hypothetical protein
MEIDECDPVGEFEILDVVVDDGDDWFECDGLADLVYLLYKIADGALGG